MLYSLDTSDYISDVPHRREYELWRSMVPSKQFQEICDHLDSLVAGNEIHTSSWIPGSDWTGTIYQPLYDALQDERQAAMFFGLILWDVIMRRPDVWAFGRYEKNGIPIEGMTYFKLENPPST